MNNSKLKFIIDNFPAETHKYFENLNDPLDKIEVFNSIFKESKIRLIFAYEKSMYGIYEWNCYYHYTDSLEELMFTETINDCYIKYKIFGDLNIVADDTNFITNFNINKMLKSSKFVNDFDFVYLIHKINEFYVKKNGLIILENVTLVKVLFLLISKINDNKKITSFSINCCDEINASSEINDETQINITDIMKKKTTINKEFIDDFYSCYNKNDKNYGNKYVIDIEIIVKWLNVKKNHIKRLLCLKFVKDVDYVECRNLNKQGKSTTTKKIIMLTRKCSEMLCIDSKSPKSEIIKRQLWDLNKFTLSYDFNNNVE